jgi:LPS sulfotransferase NodH
VLEHVIGYQLTRPPGHPKHRLRPPGSGRLLTAPVFILSAPRSGSTLLRAILGSHSRLYAPPEIPLLHLGVRAETEWIRVSLQALQLTSEEVDHLLWDRLLGDVLTRSGKQTIVIKTPSNVLAWPRIAQCWPDARYIFLLRHPAAAVASAHAAWNERWHPGESGTYAEAVTKALRYLEQVEAARQALPGLSVRYEDLTREPEATVTGLCGFLGVPFEPAMLDYGQFASSRFRPGLGDASAKIRSGRIQPTAAAPAEIPAELRPICVRWGYLGPADPGPRARQAARPGADSVPRQAGAREPAE